MRRISLLLTVCAASACGVFGGEDSPGDPATPPDGVDGGTDGGNPPVGGPAADFAFTIDPIAAPLAVTQGASATLKLTVKRGKNLTGPIVVKTGGLRDGVTSAPLTITGNTGDLVISAPAGAAQGPANGTIDATSGAAKASTPLQTVVRGKPGDVDTTFAGGGMVTTLFGVGFAGRVVDMLLAPDESIYLLGHCDFGVDNHACVVHVAADGTLDKAYGSAATPGVGHLTFQAPHAAAVDATGRVVVVGGSAPATTVMGRLDATGKADAAFGDGSVGPGTIQFGTGGNNGQAQGAFCVAIRAADGDIFVAWDNYDVGLNVMKNGSSRFASNGLVRTTYGNTGAARSGAGYMTAIGVRNDPADPSHGNFLQIWANPGATAAAGVADIYQINGDTATLDAQFGPSIRSVPIAGITRADSGQVGLVQLADRSVVTVFQGSGGFYLYKLGPDFAGAPAFGATGLAGPYAVNGSAGGLAVQADGKVLVALIHEGGQEVARFTAAGTLDTTFGNSGHVTTLIGTNSAASKVVVQKSGRILVSGQQLVPKVDAALTAYWP